MIIYKVRAQVLVLRIVRNLTKYSRNFDKISAALDFQDILYYFFVIIQTLLLITDIFLDLF